MAVLKLEKAEVFEPLPADAIIQVEVTEIKEREQTNRNNGNTWTKLEFTFNIIGLPTALEERYGSLINTKLWGSVNARFSDHPDNQLRQWVEALLNLNLAEQIGFELDTDNLIGRKARAVISRYTKNNGREQHQVAALLPAGGQMSEPQITVTKVAQPVSTPGVQAMAWADEEPPF